MHVAFKGPKLTVEEICNKIIALSFFRSTIRTYPLPRRGGGGLVPPQKFDGGVRHASWEPYPISDQKLWFSLPYFRPAL